MIVFDASALVSAALKKASVPERALLKADEIDILALSDAVEAEIVEVLGRPKFARIITPERRQSILAVISREAVRFKPSLRVNDCRDTKDNKYLELALAAGAEIIVSGDEDLLVLDPWRGVRILRPAAYLELWK